MNYERIYEYRFSSVDTAKKKIIWNEIAAFMYQKLGSPQSVLDPAAGMCEFINAIPAKEKWAVDLNEIFLEKQAAPDVKRIIGDVLQLDFPAGKFDAVFISNFLEHLHTQEEVAFLLEKMFATLKPGGRIAVMGPNFKYASGSYFDFADHTVILSELGLAEHLYGAGFTIRELHPQFLPLSFRGRLPVNKFLTRTYLQLPVAWKFFGKQFLIVAEK